MADKTTGLALDRGNFGSAFIQEPLIDPEAAQRFVFLFVSDAADELGKHEKPGIHWLPGADSLAQAETW